MAIRRRTWIAVAILSILALVAGLAALGIVYDHLQRPRFVATASPIQVSTPECMALITDPRHGYNSGSAQAMCQDASEGIWFRAEVKNVGHRLAFIRDCVVIGLDPAGHPGLRGHPPHGRSGAGRARRGPGDERYLGVVCHQHAAPASRTGEPLRDAMQPDRVRGTFSFLTRCATRPAIRIGGDVRPADGADARVPASVGRSWLMSVVPSPPSRWFGSRSRTQRCQSNV